MNRILYVFAFASLFAAAHANAASYASESEVVVEAEPSAPSNERLNRVSLGPVTLGLGVLPIEYERSFSDHISIAAGAQAYFPSILLAVGVVTLGAGGTLGLRYYPWAETALEGFWFGPEFFGNLMLVSSSGNGTAGITLGGVAKGGYAWTWDNGLSINVGIGAGLAGHLGTIGVLPLPALSANAHVGYAF